MQTNIARASDYDQACTAGNTRTTILIVDDDTTARLTLSAMISNEDEYRVFLGSDRPQTDQRPGATAMVYAAARTRRQYQNLMREGS